jgi:hypothetical protein
MAISFTFKYKSQQGAALLLFMLILVMASSYTLLSKLNTARKPYVRDIVTSKVLAEAKKTLISYAVTYPERSGTVDTTAGPGYMSCPDTDNNGSPNTPCGPNAEGRFPGEFWGSNDYLDSSGQRLWYAISDNFRNIGAKFQPMNSDTPGQLSVDGINDIVAVIIAPGEPVTGQNNRPSNNIADYLEGENANSDNVFTLNSGGNDILVYITRQELMSEIEKRVLNDIARMINNYQTSYTAYPWLSPFANPSASIFRGTLNTIQGHLPYHWSNDPDSVSVGTGLNIIGRNPFQSVVGWKWHTDPGTATTSNFPWGTLPVDCIRNVDCIDPLYPQITQVTTPPVDCTWTDKDTADCTNAGWVTMSSITCDRGCGDFTCTREYNVNIPEFSGTASINNPTNLDLRTRNVSLNDLPVQNNAVQIRDRYTGDDPANSCLTTTTSTIGGGSINFVAGTTGSVEATIQYDLDIDDSELPEWFVANDWQNLIYVAYGSGELPLPGDTTDILPGPADGNPDNVCTAGVDCMSININGTVNNNIRAAVFSAGIDFNSARPSNLLTDYFENENSNPIDDLFVKNRLSNIYNDQTRIISTTP